LSHTTGSYKTTKKPRADQEETEEGRKKVYRYTERHNFECLYRERNEKHNANSRKKRFIYMKSVVCGSTTTLVKIHYTVVVIMTKSFSISKTHIKMSINVSLSGSARTQNLTTR
jgi:hypothetical protein